MQRRKPLQRKTPIKRGGYILRKTKLRFRSPRKEAANQKYEKAKAEHFKAHPTCQHPDGCTKSLLNGDKMDLHHLAGRNGPLLYCRQYFATACRQHHDRAKNFPAESRANGWLVDVSAEEVRRLKLVELGVLT